MVTETRPSSQPGVGPGQDRPPAPDDGAAGDVARMQPVATNSDMRSASVVGLQPETIGGEVPESTIP